MCNITFVRQWLSSIQAIVWRLRQGIVARNQGYKAFLFAIINSLRSHIVKMQPVFGGLFPFSACFAVVAVRVDTDAATWGKFTPDFDVFWVKQFDEIFHDDIYAVFVKVTVVAEAKQIELERFALYEFLVGYVGNVYSCKIRLTSHRAEAGKFRTVEFDKVVVVGVFVVKTFQYIWVVCVGIVSLSTAEQCYTL